ncbi:putative syntaxin-3 [Aphelenchoides besseyi]|nr:putative syntaxin-3 [Aphelenchoides besseyi]
MVKDRLAEFQKLSGKNATTSRSRASTVDSTIRLEDGRPAANDHLLEDRDWEQMDAFLRNVSEVRKKISEMEALLQKLREIQKHKLVSPGSHSGKLSLKTSLNPIAESTEELNEVQSRFNNLSQIVSRFIHEINKEVEKMKKSKDAVARIKTDQARTITRTFQNIIIDFNTEQVNYKEQCQKTISKYLSIAGLQMEQEDVDDAIEKGHLFNTVGVMMAERDKKVLFEDVKSRHDDIVKLEASIRELHEIFQDMAMLIESQGEIVDRIETNVNYAAEYAERALRNVNHAKRAKNRNIKLKIAAVVCLAIVILLIIVLLSTVFCIYLPFIMFALRTKFLRFSLGTVRYSSKSPVETLRSRLLYQSKKRGILENDILIGGFAESQLGELNEKEMREYDRVINGEHMEWDLYYYISGKKPPPSELTENSVFQKMIEYAKRMKTR